MTNAQTARQREAERQQRFSRVCSIVGRNIGRRVRFEFEYAPATEAFVLGLKAGTVTIQDPETGALSDFYLRVQTTDVAVVA